MASPETALDTSRTGFRTVAAATPIRSGTSSVGAPLQIVSGGNWYRLGLSNGRLAGNWAGGVGGNNIGTTSANAYAIDSEIDHGYPTTDPPGRSQIDLAIRTAEWNVNERTRSPS